MPEIRTRRVYAPPDAADGHRVLVDGLWPRGLKKAEAAIDAWHKDVAPSADLRRWFGHDPARWEEFCRRYADELARRPEAVERLRGLVREATVTLLFAARDEKHNNAVALKRYLEADAGGR